MLVLKIWMLVQKKKKSSIMDGTPIIFVASAPTQLQ